MVLHDERVLSGADNKHFITYPFELPAGCRQLALRFSFAPHKVGSISNVLSLTVFDAQGFRGSGHCCRPAQDITITADSATPGYISGPLPAGRWLVQVETHGLVPGTICSYTLDIAAERGLVETDVPRHVIAASPARPPRGGPGWYRGDLHTHTFHSDGDVSVAGRAAAAEARDLDFFFLTDHNTVSGLLEFDALPSPAVLPLGGIELTTFWGHALCLGGRDWMDWRAQPGTGEMAALARAAEAVGRVFIIAHPHAIDDPYCTGCAWHYEDVMPGPARAVEVWNGPWDGDSGNEQNLALWYSWLNEGYRTVGTCGTDCHGLYREAGSEPFAHVYAEMLEEAALLEAIRRGRLYSSTGSRLELQARAGDERAGIGDVLALDGNAAEFRCEWAGCPPGSVVAAVADGQVVQQWRADAEGQAAWRIESGRASWCAVEIRGAGGQMLAITNPVFCTA